MHWLIAALIVLQFVLAKLAENAGTPLEELVLLANHKSVGISIFLLAALRLAWRMWQGVPRALPMPEWQFIASQISHWSMYALIFLLPITGWLTSSASAHSVSWFNLVALPDLVAPDPALEEKFEDIHELHATLLFAIVLVHIAGAVLHSLRKDRALARITSAGPILVFVAIAALGSATLTRVRTDAGTVVAAGTPLSTTAATSGTTDLEAWSIDYAASQIRFTAMQAGAGVNGEWREWRADLHFDEARVAEGLFDVRVVVASVETHDDDRDELLQQAEWFDGEKYPEVRFFASRFTPKDDGSYAALGALTVKGRTFPVNLEFRVSRDGGTYVLDGAAELDRLALDLGAGEWSDTRWIGRFVTVNVHVEANAAN